MRKIKLWIIAFVILTKAVIQALPGLIAALFEQLGNIICLIPDFVCSIIKDMFSADYEELINLAIDEAKEKINNEEL